MVSMLRKYLLECPRKFGNKYDNKVRSDLRRALFLAASDDGKYFNLFFPDRPEAKDDQDSESEDEEEYIMADNRDDPAHPGRPCVRRFSKGEPTYRCLTCGLDETCVLCSYCFNPEDHQDHQVTVSISPTSNGGVCDCGDPEAWVKQFSCKYHEIDNFTASDLPQDLYDALLETVETAMDYLIDVLSHSDVAIYKFTEAEQVLANFVNSQLSPSVYGARDDHDDSRFTLSMWNDQRYSFTHAEILIKKATGKNDNFCKMVSQHIDSHGRATVRVSSSLGDLMDAKRQMAHTMLIPTSTAGMNEMATSVRSSRDSFREEMCDTIIHWLDDISKCPIQGNYFAIRDIVCKAFCRPWRVGSAKFLGEVPFNLDADVAHYKDRMEKRAALTPEGDIPEYEDYQENMAEFEVPEQETNPIGNSGNGIGRDPDTPLTTGNPDYWVRGRTNPDWSAPEVLELLGCPMSKRARVCYLLFFDIRLWKSIRNVLQNLYISVMVAHPGFKSILGIYYAEIYRQIVEMHILLDREHEVSVITHLSTQLLTAPSIATQISKYKYLTDYMGALFLFFTRGAFGPADAVNVGYHKVEMLVLRAQHTRFRRIFHDMNYILNRTTEKENTCGAPDRIRQVSDLFLLFQGAQTMKRQVGTHIEFEIDTWVYFFYPTACLLQLGQMIASGSRSCRLEDNEAAIRIVSNALTLWGSGRLNYRSMSNEANIPEYVPVHWGSEMYHTLKFDVASQDVSLYHPLHAFLSWLIECGQVTQSRRLREILTDVQLAETPNPMELAVHPRSLALSVLFEYPMRVLVLLSQIKVGLWVRNGVNVVSQLNHYRDQSLRDTAFARDLFMVQTSLAVHDPALVFVSIVHRFGLSQLSGPDSKHVVYEDKEKYMIEELLHTLLVLVLERTHLYGYDEKETKRAHILKQIVHALCFRPNSFTEICKQISEDLTSEELFETILLDVADIQQPTGNSESRKYKLKDQYFDMVDPYFAHYSSNQRNDCLRVLQARLAKKQGCTESEVVVMPPMDPPLEGVFKNIGAFTKTRPFALFCKSVLEFLVGQPDGDITGLLLHLILVAVTDKSEVDIDPQEFATTASGPLPDYRLGPNELGAIIVEPLCKLYEQEHLKNGAVIRYLVDKLAGDDPALRELSDKLAASVASSAVAGSSGAMSPTASKRELAKQRQARIMEEFKQQQQAFEQNHADNSAEDEDMEGAESNEDVCILCMQSKSNAPGAVFGVSGLFTSSNVYRRFPADHGDLVEECLNWNGNLDQSRSDVMMQLKFTCDPEWQKLQDDRVARNRIGPGFPNENHGTVATSCGHGMHHECYLELRKTILKQTQVTRNKAENPEAGEFLCPLCKSFNDVFLPVFHSSNERNWDDVLNPPVEAGGSSSLSSENKIFLDYLDGRFEVREPLTSSVILGNQLADATQAEDEGEEQDDFWLDQLIVQWENRFEPGLAAIMTRIENPADLIKILSNTVQQLEISLRGVATQPTGLFFEQLSSNNVATLRNMCEIVFVALTQIRTAQNHTLSRQFMTVNQSAGIERLAVFLCYDRFVGLQFNHMLRYFVSQKLALNLDYFIKTWAKGELGWTRGSVFEHMPKFFGHEQGVEAVKAIAERLLQHQEGVPGITESVAATIYTLAVKATTVCLREACLLIYGLYASGETPEISEDDDIDDCENDWYEAQKLTRFLKIPSLDDILQGVLGSSEEFSIEARAFNTINAASKPMVPFYFAPQRLLHLPERLDDLYTPGYHASPSVKQQSKSMSTDPAVCLFCGESVNTQYNDPWDPDKSGECNKHMRKHHRDKCIFLLPKKTSILLLSKDQGSFHPAPYFDLHGERDEVMKRGRPQFLNEARYEKFMREMWLQPGIPNYIARQLDSSHDPGGWETL
ncbi:E3 ubiquitin-protein ligase ubr11 [Yarrowia sp. E02]|nr:E3 ubiquitin-protein ligase ubr11 [Yarrowia sp. E02]